MRSIAVVGSRRCRLCGMGESAGPGILDSRMRSRPVGLVAAIAAAAPMLRCRLPG